jgi:hypothetical protein
MNYYKKYLKYKRKYLMIKVGGVKRNYKSQISRNNTVIQAAPVVYTQPVAAVYDPMAYLPIVGGCFT